MANGWIKLSPAAQLTAAMVGAPPAARTRVLSDDEIRWVMTLDGPYGPLLRFLLATGLRIGEAYGGHREGQFWVVPSAASKNKREHRVWLSEVALAQLDQHPWAVRRYAVQHWLSENDHGWSAHDLRRTFSTRNNAMGVPPYVVEKMLNHSFGGVMAVYNRADLRHRAPAGPGGMVGMAGRLGRQAAGRRHFPAAGVTADGVIGGLELGEEGDDKTVGQRQTWCPSASGGSA